MSNRTSSWDHLRRDLRFAARSLWRNPGVTLVAALTFALGVGAISAVFSLASAVLLRPLPYRAPERLVAIDGTKAAEAVEKWPISYLDFLDWRRRSRSFTGLAAQTDQRSFKLRGTEGTELVPGEMVSANYFDLLGIRPVAGRGFLPAEDALPGGNRLAVLGYDLWQRRFGGEPGIVGTSVEINEIPYTVVGVMPAGFRGLTDGADVWLPISMATTLNATYLNDRAFRWLSVVGRLRPGVSAEAAGKELLGIAAQLSADHAGTNAGIGAQVTPLRDSLFGDLRPILWTLLGGAAFVLFIGCTNIANLLLAKAVHRQREISLRLALGVGRPSLVRQLLVESVMVGILGCTLGLVAARLTANLLVRQSGLHLMSFAAVRFDPLVVLAVVLVSLLAAVLFGLAPAFFAARTDVAALMKEDAQGSTRGVATHRFQNLLIIAEVAVALPLLLGAGLMIKAFQQRSHVELGFQPDRLLTLRLHTKSQSYPNEESLRGMIREVLGRVGSLPGVTATAMCGPAMPTDPFYGLYFELADRPGRGADDQLLGLRHHVSPGYFAALGVPVLRGRVFTPQDTHRESAVVVVSDTLAKRFWPGENPLGKRLKAAATPWLTVVGVVGDVRHNGRGDSERPAPDLYLPLLTIVPRTPPVLNLLVRTGVAPEALAPVVQQELKRIVPDLPVYDVRPMTERLSDQLASRRFLVLLMGFFSLTALLLAAVGVYGVISYAVSQRTREFGIRIALGAQSQDVVRSALMRGLILALIGIAFGVIGGIALTFLLGSRFYGADAIDPTVLGGTALLLLAVTLVANYLPARRAVRIDPLTAFRGN
ncbi:MAG TPA: ABC transporter permease [Thermoanaerobaculia bacterium]|nr:ABC transporter permease [Thermoanaerobaculia bacterium]